VLEAQRNVLKSIKPGILSLSYHYPTFYLTILPLSYHYPTFYLTILPLSYHYPLSVYLLEYAK
jgi:hypothetical protein